MWKSSFKPLLFLLTVIILAAQVQLPTSTAVAAAASEPGAFGYHDHHRRHGRGYHHSCSQTPPAPPAPATPTPPVTPPPQPPQPAVCNCSRRDNLEPFPGFAAALPPTAAAGGSPPLTPAAPSSCVVVAPPPPGYCPCPSPRALPPPPRRGRGRGRGFGRFPGLPVPPSPPAATGSGSTNAGSPSECVVALAGMATCGEFLTSGADETPTPQGECCRGLGAFLDATRGPGGDGMLRCLCPVILGDVNKVLPKPMDPVRMMYLPIACGVVLPPQVLYICFTGRPSPPVVSRFSQLWENHEQQQQQQQQLPAGAKAAEEAG